MYRRQDQDVGLLVECRQSIIGDIPQNVNFAIKVGTLVSFLEAHNVAYEADSTTRELSNTQRAERAEASSAQVECRK